MQKNCTPFLLTVSDIAIRLFHNLDFRNSYSFFSPLSCLLEKMLLKTSSGTTKVNFRLKQDSQPDLLLTRVDLIFFENFTFRKWLNCGVLVPHCLLCCRFIQIHTKVKTINLWTADHLVKWKRIGVLTIACILWKINLFITKLLIN